jgi:6-pyruvoyltetrahydropterin/6-carboxytetrahydropterin synthase
VRGEVDPVSGWFIDYAEIADAFEPLRLKLDHYYLNEIDGLENATSENLARWVWERLEGNVRGLHRVSIRETCTARCDYFGE